MATTSGTTSKTTTKKAPTLRSLQTSLKSNQAMLNLICQFVNAATEETSANQLTVRLEKLDELWVKVNSVISDIETHEDFKEDDTSCIKARSDFGTTYYDTKAIILDRLKELEEPLENVSDRGLNTTVQPTIEHVRLPQIKLQTFDGNIDEWLSFRDLYSSLIHFKTDLPDVEKFHYLKGCLAGEAKSLIDPLAITRANYKIAWDILTKRYNDSKLLKRRQVEHLFKLPTLTKESGTELQSLLENFERLTHTLDQLVESTDYKDLLLTHIVCSRLDPSTRRGWEEYSSTKEQDKVKDVTEFLQRRIKVLGSLPSRVSDKKTETVQPIRKKQPLARSSNSATQAPGRQCIACPETHPLYQCHAFQRLPVSGRDKLLRNHSLCRNCFRRGHQANDCPSRYLCRNCKGKHHTLVCFHPESSSGTSSGTTRGPSEGPISQAANATDSTNENQASNSTVSSNVSVNQISSVLLATAVVLVEDDEGVTYLARALLDSGSECNFMAERLCQRLRVQRRRANIEVLGIGNANVRVKHRVEAHIKSRVSGFAQRMEFLVLPNVTSKLPTASIPWVRNKIPDGVDLADPAFFESRSVDMVIGIQYFFELFHSGNKIPLGTGLPMLSESVFGWVVSGVINGNDAPQTSCYTAVATDLEELLSRFWSCEEIETSNNYSPEEVQCEEYFKRTVKRDTDGRYTVSYPRNEGVLAEMGESRDIAFRRLLGLERRLGKDPELRRQYNEFMAEYEQLGHMRKVEASSADFNKRCYLPHHAVVKEDSTTTKVRVVFDASCKTSSGTSLNDSLLVGPVIQDDLRSIILRCRTRQIMVVSDVEKMFRQIRIAEGDMQLQNVLWRADPESEAETYELRTVTYGTKPAPFLATRTLRQLASDEKENFPLAAKAIEEDVYMDDVITGADEVDETVELRTQLDSMMESGGFRLRKWASNCPEVLQGVAEDNLAIARAKEVQLDPDPSVKTLGLVWLPETDHIKFRFKVEPPNSEEKLTKRKVLSIIASLFDPLGLVEPVITKAKIFMQLLWSLEDEAGEKLEWDSPLPSKVQEEWQAFHLQLPLLNDLIIPRCIILPRVTRIQLHSFSDASERAYGACCYLKSENSEGEVRVVLLTSKSKVAPLKRQSIPRLELCGALLAAELSAKVVEALKLEKELELYYWTDSTCVLQWLKAVPSVWATFVSNRVAKIQRLTEHGSWDHVPGIENPADSISRGTAPDEIGDHPLWWEGPPWLKENQDAWPKHPVTANQDEGDLERRKTALHGTAADTEKFSEWYLAKFSSFTAMVRRTAIWIRLIDALKSKRSDVRHGALAAEELNTAEQIVIRKVQLEEFGSEWKALSRKETVSRSSPLRWFNPQLSRDNLIRVGGRLGHSLQPDEAKHPIVLPARHPFTKMLLKHYHLQLLHAGPQLLLGTVRLKYWPLGGRSVARNVVHQCQRCFRTKPNQVQQFMGELPPARVIVSRPFAKTGVDYFGPVYIRPAPKRPVLKGYVALFVCMCTKAIHMELVSDLSTNRFLQALRRFVGRRGLCSDIYSDNGKNFVGARNQLQELFILFRSDEHQDLVAKECTKYGIQWHFNPPAAPHFGGLWEAAVRSAKFHLLRVLGEECVSFEDFNTLLVQVENCLNSRPITAMSDDPEDLEPLTPGHFLIGASLQEVPCADFQNIPMNRLNHWQAIQRKYQDFWRRWKTEYLAQLQGRTKRWQPPIPITTGKLVVLKEENAPPIRWKLGRIVEVHPGTDGTVRVVTVKTATGLFKRPVEKICILPSSSQPEEPPSS